jgi:hypothetical protein
MNKPYRAIAALGAALTFTTMAVAAAVPAAALPTQAAAQGWRVVFSQHYGAAADFSGYTTVIASGPRDAWAFGANDLSGSSTSPQEPVAVHWNGTAWQASTLPSGLNSEIIAASAVSASNVWAVTQFGGYVLHWNGVMWSVATQLPGSSGGFGQLTGVTALSSTDVWAFGGSGFTSGLGTWHYDGATWTQQTGAASDIPSASAVSASNIWAVGSDGNAPQDEIVHYDGTAWQAVAASALTGVQFGSSSLALSATNVWATGEKPPSSTMFLVHFNGNAWSQVALPWTMRFGGLIPDGQGGLWMFAADTTGNSWAVHRSAGGTWSRTEIALLSSGGPAALAMIPGTTSLWAAGGVDTTAGSAAAVWADGSIPAAGPPPPVAMAALATNGVPYARAPQLGGGTSWQSLGGTVSASPAVAAPPNPNGTSLASPLFIAPGANHLLYIRGVTGSWQRLAKEASCLAAGAVITSSATSSTLTVACEGLNHALYYDTATVPTSGLPAFTSAWKGLGGTMSAAPAVAQVGSAVTFFVRGTTGRIYTRSLTTGFTAAPWTCLGQPAASQEAASGVTFFACQGTNHGLYVSANGGTGWSPTVRLSGSLAAGPAIAAASQVPVLAVVGSNGVVYEGTPLTAYSGLSGIVVSGVEAAALN